MFSSQSATEEENDIKWIKCSDILIQDVAELSTEKSDKLKQFIENLSKNKIKKNKIRMSSSPWQCAMRLLDFLKRETSETRQNSHQNVTKGWLKCDKMVIEMCQNTNTIEDGNILDDILRHVKRDIWQLEVTSLLTSLLTSQPRGRVKIINIHIPNLLVHFRCFVLQSNQSAY